MLETRNRLSEYLSGLLSKGKGGWKEAMNSIRIKWTLVVRLASDNARLFNAFNGSPGQCRPDGSRVHADE